MMNPRTVAVENVKRLIREAFEGVTLGDGIGLQQGQEIDSYSAESVVAAAREQDEKLDWNRIPPHSLNAAASSLAFFDDYGMRFHLAAFLLADLEGTFNQDVCFFLMTDPEAGNFALFTAEQRSAVREFLSLRLSLLDEPGHQFSGGQIQQAIDGYWSLAAQGD